MRRSDLAHIWPCWQLSVLALLLLLLSITACQDGRPTPTTTRTPFAPQIAPTPASLQAYVEQAYLRQTRRLEFADPETKQRRVIDDPEVIQQVIDLLLSPDKTANETAPGPQEPFGFAMIVPVKSADHAVTADYYPQTHILALGNIATGTWPIFIKGRYMVPPSFGPALFGILDIDS